VSDYLEIITAINNDIEDGKLTPDDNQKITISYIATQAKESITEIERLENLMDIVLDEEE
jgi:hypothetical protein